MTTAFEIAVSRWLDTPYMPNQCCKGIAVDCLHFVLAVWDELLGIEHSLDTYEFQSRSDFLKTLTKLRRKYAPIPVPTMRRGNIVVYNEAMAYHVGLVLEEELIVHASGSLGKVAVSTTHTMKDPCVIYEHPERETWLTQIQ